MASVLLVDQGNTATKYQVWSQGLLLESAFILNQDVSAVEFLGRRFNQIIVASVAEEQYLLALKKALTPLLLSSAGRYVELSTQSVFKGLQNSYDVPESMGVDRWLAIIGAMSLLGSDFRVINFGTAVTIDVVNSGLEHLGGKIVPNFAMMQKNLLEKTGKIDFNASLVSEVRNNALGKSTQQCVQYGLYSMIEAYIERELGDLPSKTIVTGGGAMMFTPLWSKYPVLWMNDLVLLGIKCWSEEAA